MVQRVVIVICILFFVTPSLYSQFSQKDSSLVYTTYTREFNKEIVNSYLNSKSPEKINAALLSIAQSDDTSFVKEITKLDFNEYSKEILFALGEIGECYNSTNFIFEQLKNKNLNDFQKRLCVQTLGKTGGVSAYKKLVNLMKTDDELLKYFPLSAYNFVQSGIIKTGDVKNLLTKSYERVKLGSQDYYDCVFTLYRLGVPKELNEDLLSSIKTLTDKKNLNENEVNSLQYLLGCVRKSDPFKIDFKLFMNLAQTGKFVIIIEAIKDLSHFPFKDKSKLKEYLSFLNNSNPNISRQTANSISNIKVDEKLKHFLKDYLSRIIEGKNLDSVSKGELLQSYIHLFNPTFDEVKNYKKDLNKIDFINACSRLNKSEYTFDYLIKVYNQSTNGIKIASLSSLANFNNFSSDKRYSLVFLDALSSSKSPLISISADGIDSSTITRNKNEVKNVILKQVNRYLNNPDFQEKLNKFI